VGLGVALGNAVAVAVGGTVAVSVGSIVAVELSSTTGVCVGAKVPGGSVAVSVPAACAAKVAVGVHVGGSTNMEVAVRLGKAAVAGRVAGGKGLKGTFGLMKMRPYKATIPAVNRETTPLRI